MSNPTNPLDSHDFHKFVLQNDPDLYFMQHREPPKPFKVDPPEKSLKSKKDHKKSKDRDDEESESDDEEPKLRKPFT